MATDIPTTLSFKADGHLHEIEQALGAIGVLMDCISTPRNNITP